MSQKISNYPRLFQTMLETSNTRSIPQQSELIDQDLLLEEWQTFYSNSQIETIEADIVNNFDLDKLLLLDKEVAAENPNLYQHVAQTLGYGSFAGYYVDELAGYSTPNAEQAIAHSLLPYGADASNVMVDVNGQLSTNIAESSQFVTFTLEDGSTISFDGDRAGRVANIFAAVYNNSETFRDTIQETAQEYGGQYGFHILDGESPFEGGFNVAGNGLIGSSGVFINNAAIDQGYFNPMLVIVHEVGHELFGFGNANDGDLGLSHSREHSIWAGSILNEVNNSGLETNINIDLEDYSNNIVLLDASDIGSFGEFVDAGILVPLNSDDPDYQQFLQQYQAIQAAIHTGDFAQAADLWNRLRTAEPQPRITVLFQGSLVTFDAKDWIDLYLLRDSEVIPQDLENYLRYSVEFNNLVDAINAGDFSRAVDVMSDIEPNVTLSFARMDPQQGFDAGNTELSYNVRDLFTQQLLINADSSDWFNTDSDTLDRVNLNQFFNTMIDADYGYRDTLLAAAEGVRFDLNAEGFVIATTSDNAAVGRKLVEMYEGTGVNRAPYNQDQQLGKWELYSAGITDFEQNRHLRHTFGDGDGFLTELELQSAFDEGLISVDENGKIQIK